MAQTKEGFYLGRQFRTYDPVTCRYNVATVVMVRNFSGLLYGCELCHVMMNDNPDDIWRVFKWPNGEMNRITRVNR